MFARSSWRSRKTQRADMESAPTAHMQLKGPAARQAGSHPIKIKQKPHTNNSLTNTSAQQITETGNSTAKYPSAMGKPSRMPSQNTLRLNAQGLFFSSFMFQLPLLHFTPPFIIARQRKKKALRRKKAAKMLDAAPPPVYNKKTGFAPAQPRGVAQLVARVVWDHEAAGSSPVTSISRV